jgi:hypothetical protein
MPLGQGRGPEGCANGQTAVEAQPTRLIANDVLHAPGDRAGCSPMALPATAVLGGPFDAVADVGDSPGEAVQTCREAGLTPAVARPIPAAHQQLGRFSTEDFTSDGATDPSQCPAGEPRTCRCARSTWDGLSALRRRSPAGPVRSSRRARATQADDA